MSAEKPRGRPRGKPLELADVYPFPLEWSHEFDLINERGANRGTEKVHKSVIYFPRVEHLPEPSVDIDAASWGTDNAWAEKATLTQAELVSGAWSRKVMARMLLAHREEIVSDGMTLLCALELVAVWHLSMPDWMATAFVKRFRSVTAPDIRSLDRAFNHRPESERTLATKKRHAKLVQQIKSLVIAKIFQDSSRAIDNEFYELIGAEIGIKRSLCQTLYLNAVRENNAPSVDLIKKVARGKQK